MLIVLVYTNLSESEKKWNLSMIRCQCFSIKSTVSKYLSLHQRIRQEQYITVMQLLLETDLWESHRVLQWRKQKKIQLSQVFHLFHLQYSVGKTLWPFFCALNSRVRPGTSYTSAVLLRVFFCHHMHRVCLSDLLK